MLAGILPVQLLQRERDAVVDARAPGRAEPLVQRLVDQRVHETEAAELLARLVQQRCCHRGLQPVQQLTLGGVGQLREELELERAADHGRKRQHLLRLGPEALDAADDHVAHALRQAEGRRAIDAPPLGRRVVQEPLGLHQAAKHFPDEERIPVGLARDLPREQQRVRIQVVPGRRRHHLGHLGRSEALQRDPLDALDSPQIRQDGVQRMLLPQIRVAEGDDHLERTRLGGPHHVLEQRDRLTVRPVQIVEHEAHGHRRRQLHERPRDGREEQEALGLGIGALRLRHLRQSPRQLAGQSRELAAVTFDVPLEHLRRCVFDQLRAHRDPRLVRHRQLFRACTPQDGKPLAVRTMARERRQAALADPGLAGDQHHLPRPRAGSTARALHDRTLRVATHEPRPRHRSQQRRHRPAADTGDLVSEPRPRNGEYLDRLGVSLQLELAGGLEPDAVEPPGQQPHGGRYQDSIRRRLVAQPRRLDRRTSEVLPVLHRGLARAQTDPHLQLRLGPPIAALDQLLHGHRTPHRRRRRAESDHHPVAGAPELAPARRADRLAQDVEVLVPQLVRANRADGIRQPRRTDEVGHQNRRQLDRLRHRHDSRGRLAAVVSARRSPGHPAPRGDCAG